jgi:hypothetical protein
MKAVLRLLGALLGSVALGVGLAALAGALRPEPEWSAEAEEAARQAVARELRRPLAELAFRNISFHRSEAREIRSICGLVRQTGPRDGPLMDFVAHVQRQRPWNLLADAEFRAEVAVARDMEGRREVYVARRRYCPDTAPAVVSPPRPMPEVGPPPQGPGPMVSAEPPPATGSPAVHVPPAGRGPAEGGGGPALRVVVRQPANVRAGPSGSATVLRTVPRGAEFRLLDRAASGWMRVAEPGTAEPMGWVHASRVEVAPP